MNGDNWSSDAGLPLQGLIVLDFSQFLAGPSCALRLADLGAEVIKIERPDGGDLCRRLYISDLELDGDSTLFHTINRNKRSFSADLKNTAALSAVKKLIARADVLIQNFRPGVMERLGLGDDVVREINPRLVYGAVTGYGDKGPWRDKPGQDLLVQSMSGLLWLNGDADDGPIPFGVSIADILTGAHLAQGILACLVRRGVTGSGGRVDVSLLESTLDFQFEMITTYVNGDRSLPRRSRVGNANVYLGAPYGIYRTADGYLAIAMNPIGRLAELLKCESLAAYDRDASLWFTERDIIKQILQDHLSTNTTAYWLAILEPADVWCAEVLTWQRLFDQPGFEALDMMQEIRNAAGSRLITTRCPIRIDGKILKSPRGAAKVGEHNEALQREFDLTETAR